MLRNLGRISRKSITVSIKSFTVLSLIMKKELDEILKLTAKDIDEIKEAIKSGNEEQLYQKKFDCKSGSGLVNPVLCRGCQYVYKIDIRNPWLCGCYVQDYIRQVKEQIRI